MKHNRVGKTLAFALFAVVLAALPVSVKAQNANNQWQSVDSLVQKQYYTQAYEKAEKIYNKALADRDSRQILVGARYLSMIGNIYQEDNADSSLVRLQRILPLLNNVDKALGHLLLADFYADYLSSYSWRISQNKATDEADLDYKMWSVDRYRSEVYRLICEAFADSALMRTTPAESLGALVLTEEGKDGDLTPTVFDVAMYELLEIMGNMQFPKLQQYDFRQPELLYSEPDRFVGITLNPSSDTAKDCSRYVFALMQQWERFRQGRESDGMMIVLYRQRLSKLSRVVQIDRDVERKLQAQELPKAIARYRNSNTDHITQLYALLAETYIFLEKYEQAMAVIDTALSLYPDSPGGIECYNEKQQLLRKDIRLEVIDVVPSTRHQLAVIKTTNVDRVFFRIIKDADCNRKSDTKKCLLNQKVLKQWSQDIEIKKKYSQQSSYVVVPPMPQGDYVLMASPDSVFKDEGIAYVNFSVEDVAFVNVNGFQSMRGFLVDRVSGKPIANHPVKLRHPDNKGKWHTLTTIKTDKNGYYDFTLFSSNIEDRSFLDVATEWKGREIKGESHWFYRIHSIDTNAMQNYNRLFFDRPVYKPGDTVRFSYLIFEQGRREAVVSPDRKVMFLIRDINYKVLDTIRVTTDEYGTCSGSYPLAADAMPGRWSVYVIGDRSNSFYFKIEAYKQPKFTVTLTKPNRERRFGQVANVEGVAVSYSAVPIAGAKVTYEVERREKQPLWRWGWWYYPINRGFTTVATGQITTDENGLFNIEFVPQPDSSVDFTRKPCFDYFVTVKVTDINGETHVAITTLSVGFENSYVSIDVDKSDRDDVNVTVIHRNLDGNAIDGRLDFQVQRLQQPESPKLTHRLMESADSLINMPLSKKEFEELFPLYDYDGSAKEYEQWPVQKHIFDTRATLSPEKPYIYNMKGLKEGVYRFVATVRTAGGDTLQSESYVIYQPSKAPKPVTADLITVNVDKSSCIVGDTVRLQIGSPYKDVDCYVVIRKESNTLIKIITVSESYTELAVPVTESMLGGFSVAVAAVKENHSQSYSESVDVLWVNKQLDVSLETFRDKLEPGRPEQWAISIKEHDTHLPANANLLMTMYDHALDTYGHLDLSLIPWRQQYLSAAFSTIINSKYAYYYWRPVPDLKSSLYYSYTKRLFSGSDIDYIVAEVAGVGYGTARGENGMVTQKGNVRRRMSKGFVEEYESEVTNELAVVDAADEAIMEEEALSSSQLQSVVVKAQKIPVIEVGAAESGQRLTADDKAEPQQPYIRQNLNTLAFFKPTLRTDDSGNVAVTFTAPDLLTEWNIQGTAWTKDLRVGKLAAKAITQKRLMAVPNVPRFLRHGDTCIISVKVSNLSGKEQDVAVSFEMTPRDSNLNLEMTVDEAVKHITLKNGASGEVAFLVAVPRLPIFLATYKVVARGDGCSDGEQAPIPLLPSRQLVTESMAFYINGVGEKHFNMEHLTQLAQSHSNTLTHSSLTVDLTPNPLWMAIQSLPYLQRQKNPSNIYLVNAIYTNSLSFNIVNTNPTIEQIFREWEKNGASSFQSELDRNNDLKQTVMEETPWLQDAISEEQRHRDIAQFFNKASLQRQLQNDITRLLAAQRSDGGWSWIEGGRYSSLYTTQYILATLGLLQHQGIALDSRTHKAIDRALEYVDNETYKYYKKYVKNTTFEPVNLYYLYLHSYYPKYTLGKKHKEAYDFFYNNAKKHNADYRSLFDQSMLALVFNRHGDTKLATEMTRRLREKALYSDEMGLYWRDNKGGFCWNQRPIETQAMLIRTFSEVLGDNNDVARMQQWLLKQKQTTNWNTDVSTVNAIQALLLGNQQSTIKHQPIKPSNITVNYGTHTLASDTTRHQLHISSRLTADEIKPSDGNITVRKADDGIAWGAVYWQYFEDVDKIPSSAMGVTLQRKLYRIDNSGRLTLLQPDATLRVGDKVRVQLIIRTDRNLEYLELKDPRCAALEPTNTASGWSWNSGLSYYRSLTNTAQTLYIDRLEKGQYIVEYDLYVNNAGTYINAPTTIQCLYAPEFRALAPANRLTITK